MFLRKTSSLMLFAFSALTLAACQTTNLKPCEGAVYAAWDNCSGEFTYPFQPVEGVAKGTLMEMRYKGEYKDGKMHGKGIGYWKFSKIGVVTGEGVFRNNAFVKGKLTFPDGSSQRVNSKFIPKF